MARSFSNAKALSSLITAKLSDAAATRGYAAAAAAAAASGGGVSSSVRAAGAPNVMLKKEESKISWVPDPKTGYYRPENHVDAAAEANKKN